MININKLPRECAFTNECKRAGAGECVLPCYPFTVLYGNSGATGYFATTGIPKKYKESYLHNLPIAQQNKDAHSLIDKYIKNILYYIQERKLGLFLFSVPSKENPLGTGTGKTTTACTILNEYLVARVKQSIEQKELVNNPVYFVRMSELQTTYNSQFAGTNTQDNADKFQRLKRRMKTAELLVIDDIATRGVTENFNNELYEILDYRSIEELGTVFTSNIKLSDLTEVYGDRIVSRITGLTVEVGLGGKDNRKRGI